jgi:hypothetical protein
MQRVVLLSIISAFFLFCSISKTQAQEQKVDFTANWKADSTKAIIVVNITKGNPPYTFFVYDGSPYNGGKQISKTENIQKNSFEIEIERKMKVFICVYKSENNFIQKELDVTE